MQIDCRDGLLRQVGSFARFYMMINRGRIGRSGPTPVWRVYVVGFVMAVVGTTAVAAAWHAEHDADPNCVVCKLRHEPLAELAGALQVGPGDASEPAARPSVTTWIPADPDAQVPTRAPPHS